MNILAFRRRCCSGSQTYRRTNRLTGIEWQRFPLKAMVKRRWIPNVTNLAKHAEKLIGELIERAGGLAVAPAVLYRKNDHLRVNAKTDEHALKAWCWYVLATANENLPASAYRPGTVTLNFLKQVARLSPHANGPRRAQKFLAKHGIALVIVRHLNKTYLDGATLRLGDGRPVIGLTLRYDRIDNFWFCLLHELAHVGRHLDRKQGDTFIDDLTLRKMEGEQVDRGKREARSRRMGRGSAHSAKKVGSQHNPKAAKTPGRHGTGARVANSSRHRGGQDSVRTTKLPTLVAIRRNGRSPATIPRETTKQKSETEEANDVLKEMPSKRMNTDERKRRKERCRASLTA